MLPAHGREVSGARRGLLAHGTSGRLQLRSRYEPDFGLNNGELLENVSFSG